jgi:septal ring factor EnvC (AmiA/AmiB activator)
MSRFSTLRSLGIALALVALPLLAGCGGVSQEEMDALEKQRQATVAAEQKVTELQAEKARLERKLAERQATKKALEDKLAETKSNLAN